MNGLHLSKQIHLSDYRTYPICAALLPLFSLIYKQRSIVVDIPSGYTIEILDMLDSIVFSIHNM